MTASAVRTRATIQAPRREDSRAARIRRAHRCPARQAESGWNPDGQNATHGLTSEPSAPPRSDSASGEAPVQLRVPGRMRSAAAWNAASGAASEVADGCAGEFFSGHAKALRFALELCRLAPAVVRWQPSWGYSNATPGGSQACDGEVPHDASGRCQHDRSRLIVLPRSSWAWRTDEPDRRLATTVPTSGALRKLQKLRRNRLDRARPQPSTQPKGLACSVTQS